MSGYKFLCFRCWKQREVGEKCQGCAAIAAIAAAERRVVDAAEAWATDDVSADTEALCERLYEAVFALRKARDSSTPESGNEEGKG